MDLSEHGELRTLNSYLIRRNYFTGLVINVEFGESILDNFGVFRSGNRFDWLICVAIVKLAQLFLAALSSTTTADSLSAGFMTLLGLLRKS